MREYNNLFFISNIGKVLWKLNNVWLKFVASRFKRMLVMIFKVLEMSFDVRYSQLTLWANWTYNVHNDKTYKEQESRNSKTRNHFLFRYETFLLTLS